MSGPVPQEEKTLWENITVICDRCRKDVKGLIYRGEATFKGTAGFYHVTDNNWCKFANPGESIVCDECMFQDSRYQEIYGIRNEIKNG